MGETNTSLPSTSPGNTTTSQFKPGAVADTAASIGMLLSQPVSEAAAARLATVSQAELLEQQRGAG